MKDRKTIKPIPREIIDLQEMALHATKKVKQQCHPHRSPSKPMSEEFVDSFTNNIYSQHIKCTYLTNAFIAGCNATDLLGLNLCLNISSINVPPNATVDVMHPDDDVTHANLFMSIMELDELDNDDIVRKDSNELEEDTKLPAKMNLNLAPQRKLCFLHKVWMTQFEDVSFPQDCEPTEAKL